MSYYTYLISSLPFLNFGAKPAFSYAGFLKRCEKLIPDEDLAILQEIPQHSADNYRGDKPVLRKWFDAEVTLRNELVRIRSSRRHIDPNKYLRLHEGYADAWLSRMAQAAGRNPSLLEGEKSLDQLRWQALDELALGHFFDFEFLAVYALKLLILERWDKISQAEGLKLLEGQLSRV